jgi:hypothetical protein
MRAEGLISMQYATAGFVSLLIVLVLSPAAAESPQLNARYVPDPAAWMPPPLRPEGFQFEIQISSLGTSYEYERVKRSIEAHDLGEYESAVSRVIAAEWGYSFTHLDGQLDGAGRAIQAGYPEPPADRAACLPVIEAFLHRQYIQGAPRPWASMNGHFPWHHYAAEFGFDQIGSEIGENINNYQWHIALNRGAARQYRRPWFIDFSAWHGPSISDYSQGKIWGEYSGPEHGHSMSLFERSLFMSYMAGAGQLTAEAGGAIAFLDTPDEAGVYPLSPYGEVCKRLRDFSKQHPDIGVALTPFGIVLDKFHGAYPGFGERKAFWHFPYTPGDTMTWNLIDSIWPGGWEVMGRDEQGAMVNGPYGDTFDILLQNASQSVLNSYPCLILSGDLRLESDEVLRLQQYVEQGGMLFLNTAYRSQFPDDQDDDNTLETGKGRVVTYGPDYDITALDALIRDALAKHLPVRVSGGVQYLVNLKPDAALVTLINNDGVTKAPREPARVDASKRRAAEIVYTGEGAVASASDIKNQQALVLHDDSRIEAEIAAGGIAVVELRIAAD